MYTNAVGSYLNRRASCDATFQTTAKKIVIRLPIIILLCYEFFSTIFFVRIRTEFFRRHGVPGKHVIIISYHYSIIIFYSAAARRQRVRKERNERGERERQPESERVRERAMKKLVRTYQRTGRRSKPPPCRSGAVTGHHRRTRTHEHDHPSTCFFCHHVYEICLCDEIHFTFSIGID